MEYYRIVDAVRFSGEERRGLMDAVVREYFFTIAINGRLR